MRTYVYVDGFNLYYGRRLGGVPAPQSNSRNKLAQAAGVVATIRERAGPYHNSICSARHTGSNDLLWISQAP
jgi:hypothetical protein